MGHLLGGLLTFALLSYVALAADDDARADAGAAASQARGRSSALVLLACQIALGGWTSANYAALACGFDFPQCQGQWWPPTDFREGFVLWRGVGVNYEGGVLDAPARAAIQIAHRIGALVVFCYLGWLAHRLARARLRGIAIAIGVLLLAAGGARHRQRQAWPAVAGRDGAQRRRGVVAVRADRGARARRARPQAFPSPAAGEGPKADEGTLGRRRKLALTLALSRKRERGNSCCVGSTHNRHASIARQYLELTKPRVVALIVFTAVIGMFLAVPGMVPLRPLIAGTIGIWLAAASAAAINHLIDQRIDKLMARTSQRPLATGALTADRRCSCSRSCSARCRWRS